MKRLNVRLPVVLACALAAGIAAGLLLCYYQISYIYLAVALIAAALVFIFCAVKLRNRTPLAVIPVALLFFLSGAANCIARLTAFSTQEVTDGQSYYITGTVAEKGKTDNGEYIVIDGATADGTALGGKIRATLAEDYGTFCDIGYRVQFTAALYANDLFPYGKLNIYAEENIKFSCSVASGELDAKYAFSLFGAVRASVRNALYNNLDFDTAAISYAMLTGSTQDMESGALTSFRYGGIAHIFAVSGLHIGIVFGIMSFLCKKLRLNKYSSAAVCLAFVFFYAGVCGFTLSSVRAAIMCAVAVAAKLTLSKYDGLNALAAAFVVITLITPLSLFSVGFELSVCAVGGIHILSKQFERLLNKCRLPRKLSAAAGVSFGAQFATLPVLSASFGYVSGAGFLLNLVVLPVLSALFMLLFAGTMLSVIVAAAAPYVLPYAALPLQAVLSFLIDAGFEKALITGLGAGLFVPIYFVALLALSDKLHIKLLTRCVSFTTAAAVLAAYVVLHTLYPFGGYQINVSASYAGGVVIIKSSSGTVVIVTQNADASRLAVTQNLYYASTPDAVILLGGEDCVTVYGDLNISCGTVYLYGGYIPLQPYSNVAVHYENNFTLCGIQFTFADGYSVLADCNGMSAAICAGEDIPFTQCNLLVSQCRNTACACDCTVYFDLSDYTYNIYDFGDLTFYFKDGALLLKQPVPYRACMY